MSDRRFRNRRPKMYSLYSDASICERSLSADLKRKVSSCLRVILVRRISFTISSCWRPTLCLHCGRGEALATLQEDIRNNERLIGTLLPSALHSRRGQPFVA